MLNSPIEEIKSKLDVVEVLQGYIKLQKAGVNFKALCPFHHEKSPSFVISPAKQIWHCFGCQKGGDIFSFVMGIEGVEFGDALRSLAQRAGVVLKKEDPQLQTERKKLYEICELATKFFIRQLEENKKVKDYLLSRGLHENSIKEFRIGFAPGGLHQFLFKSGYSDKDIEKTGLAIDGFDRFRNRIMFPIFDINSQVIGFGGRLFEGEPRPEISGREVQQSKYINTPNTLIYDKSQVLYGLDRAKLAIRKKDQCILVEGYMDAIMVYQIGFQNVVATSGTALTFQQLKILKRYTGNLLSAFDADLAGKNATERGIDLALQEGFDIQILSLPGAKDPADYIKDNSQDFEKQVRNAKSIMEFYFSQAFSKYVSAEGVLTAKDKKIISASLLPHLKKLYNKIEQAHWVEQLSQRLEVPADSILEEIKKMKNSTPTVPSGNASEEPNRKQLLVERFLVVLFKYPQVAEDFSAFSGPATGWKTSFPHLVLKSEMEEIKDPAKEIKYCLQEIKSYFIKEELQKINLAIKKDEIQKIGKTENLMNQFRQLTQELSQLLKI